MRTALLTTLMLALPRLALACPVCFGENDSPLAIAMNIGILAMLVIVVGVLTSFAAFFIYLMRRARLAQQVGPPMPHAEAEEGHYRFSRRDPGEGTAQC